jgi:hypothetical protein
MSKHPFGVIHTQEFPNPPKCKEGYKWIDGGEVKMIPIENWESDYECDANTKINDHTNYEKLESNLKVTGFDHSFEPGHAVLVPGTKNVSGKTARTRHKVLLNNGYLTYPTRLMEAIEGYDERVSAFSEAMSADIDHKPSRSLTTEQIAQQLWSQKDKGLPWYHGQPTNPITGEVVYGEDEFDHAYDVEFKINQIYWHPRGRSRIQNAVYRGFSTAVKINDKDEKIIRLEVKDHALGNGNDGYEVRTICMDDPVANAPSKLWSLFMNPNNKVRHILLTKKAVTAQEVKKLRETWRKTLYDYAKQVIIFSLQNKHISTEVREEYVKERLKVMFANFELYGYNHLENEKDYIKIDMFREYV